MKRVLVGLVAAVLLSGCAFGVPIYDTRRDAVVIVNRPGEARSYIEYGQVVYPRAYRNGIHFYYLRRWR